MIAQTMSAAKKGAHDNVVLAYMSLNCTGIYEENHKRWKQKGSKCYWI